jgi:hypothetical protein
MFDRVGRRFVDGQGEVLNYRGPNPHCLQPLLTTHSQLARVVGGGLDSDVEQLMLGGVASQHHRGPRLHGATKDRQ